MPFKPRETGAASPQLDTASVAAYLAKRGLIDDAGQITTQPLGGGISNVVLAVSAQDRTLVVKQALPRLRVTDEWLASPARILSEADALTLCARLTPGAVPAVLGRDPERLVLVLEHAPASWRDWKTQLLHGEINPEVAERLANLLAAWQTATLHGSLLGGRLTDSESFTQLRVEPYYRTVMSRRPEHANRIAAFLKQMAQRRLCLVHGDFSPKNVLVGPHHELWVIDWEVAHFGDSAFDVAFMLNHLLLKSLHRPQWAPGYAACARQFTQALAALLPADLQPDWRYVAGHLGCLMLARVDGMSPAEYLGARQRQHARRLGAALLNDPPASPHGLWTMRDEEQRN